MASTIRLVDDDGEVHEHEVAPGEDCPGCGRTVPKLKSDEVAGPQGERWTISVPPGEEGNLELMLIDLVNKYKDAWPLQYRAMRDSVGLEVVGGRRWKYYGLHFAVYAALTLNIQPNEEGG